METKIKTLIAVMTCRERLSTWAQAIRDTWLPLVPEGKADAIFFVGRGEGEVPEGVVALDCEDKYHGIPEKVRGMTRWAQDKYDFMLKCDDDVILKPDMLLASGYDFYDYTGRKNRSPQPFIVPYGFNYWLSNKSMKIISESPLPGDFDDERWVAEHLWNHGIQLHNDARYSLHTKLLEPNRRPLRPIRAPRRDALMSMENQEEIFSRCIYLQESLEVKLEEFKKVFEKY